MLPPELVPGPSKQIAEHNRNSWRILGADRCTWVVALAFCCLREVEQGSKSRRAVIWPHPASKGSLRLVPSDLTSYSQTAFLTPVFSSRHGHLVYRGTHPSQPQTPMWTPLHQAPFTPKGHPYIFTCGGDKDVPQLLSMQPSNWRVIP